MKHASIINDSLIAFFFFPLVSFPSLIHKCVHVIGNEWDTKKWARERREGHRGDDSMERVRKIAVDALLFPLLSTYLPSACSWCIWKCTWISLSLSLSLFLSCTNSSDIAWSTWWVSEWEWISFNVSSVWDTSTSTCPSRHFVFCFLLYCFELWLTLLSPENDVSKLPEMLADGVKENMATSDIKNVTI